MFLFKTFKLSLVFIILFSLRITAIAQNAPQAKLGVLDLSRCNYESTVPLKLNGEWIFFWKRFATNLTDYKKESFIQVPGSWSKFTGNGLFARNAGYGTYVLKIILPEKAKNWKLLLPPINSAYRLYINDSLLSSVGRLGKDVKMIPAVEPQSVQFFAQSNKILLAIQVSNYHFISGGIWSPLVLGNPLSIEKFQRNQYFLSAFLVGSLLIMGLYHFSLFFLWKRDKGPLYFGFICFFIALRESFGGPAFFYQLFPDVNYEASLKLLYSSFPICLIFFMLFFETLYSSYSKLIKRLGLMVSGLYIVLIITSKNPFYGGYLPIISLLFIIQVVHLLYLTVKKRLSNILENTLVLIGIVTLILCFVNDILFEAGSINSYFLLPLGFFVFTICQSVLLAIRFSNAFRTSERLGLALIRAEELKSIEEIKNRFFSNITHELRTPLSLIISPVEQLLQKKQDDGLLKKSLTTIQRNATSLLQLINQLLDLAKLESGNMKKIDCKGDINIFFEQIIETFRPYAADKKVTISFDKSPDSKILIFDAEKLEKIAYNLISNAIKFSPPHTIVNVAIQVEGQILRVSVHDNGIGIPQEMLDSVFERFIQAENGLYIRGGTGIGLSLVKELATFLGGQIEVCSQSGQGTLFLLSIPVMEAPSDSTEFEQVPAISFQMEHLFTVASLEQKARVDHVETILLVEDHPELMDFIGTMLSDHYNILTATNGTEAWEVCQKEMPDLVISDVMMPIMNGFELCKILKESEQTDHIGVILLTAKSGVESKIEGLSCKANDYLTKPFHFQELMLRIQNFLTYQQTLKAYHRKELISIKPLSEEQEVHPFLIKLYVQIENNLDNSDFSIDDLASELAVSSRTLNRKLSSLIGVSANDVIKNFRLKKAAELLASGKNISETAYQVGFESPSYFGQCFKNVYAITPSEFQQRRNVS